MVLVEPITIILDVTMTMNSLVLLGERLILNHPGLVLLAHLRKIFCGIGRHVVWVKR